MAASDVVARVLIDSSLPQLDKLFDYRIPAGLASDATAGVRVRVPLRSAGRIADGFIVETTHTADHAGVLSEIESVVSPIPILTPEVWALARRVADRAAGNASDVLRLAIPKRQVRVEKAWLAATAAEQVPAVEPATIQDYDSPALVAAINAGRRLAVQAVPRVVALANGGWVGHWAATLAAIASQVIAAGRSVILIVPDYRDQEQVMAALNPVVPGEVVARLDARQSNPDRYRSLLRCLADRPLVIVGNRSAVYAPADNLGLIAVWDDGDPLHAEPLSPYVHVRDAALVRQEQQHSALMFFGHTRSTHVQRLVELGWLQEVEPVRKFLPRIILTSHQEGEQGPGVQARIPSTAWRAARSALQVGPVLVQVARPGYAPKLLCESCRHAARCRICGGPLGMKTSNAIPACGWCGSVAGDWSCPDCSGTRLRLKGIGSRRTAEDLGRAFPGVRIVISDGQRPVMSVPSGPALVIATRGAEPIAEGGYRAVLLLDGENMIARESLKVGEDCLRWWTNAVSLSADAAPSILVGVTGTIARALATWALPDYAAGELVDRRRLRFPPAVRVATVSGPATDVDRVLSALRSVEPSGSSRVDVLGPTDIDDGAVRAIVRFDYAVGDAVAAQVRAEVIRLATASRRRPGSAAGAGLPKLKVRFDDIEPF